MRCPDDQAALLANEEGVPSCGACFGSLMTGAQIDSMSPGAGASLVAETNTESGAFARTRMCPECDALMSPWRIGEMDAWLEKCPRCEHFWVEKQDRRTLARAKVRQAREEYFEELSESEKQEFASGLAEMMGGERQLSSTHAAMAWLGLPVVLGFQSTRTPTLTWGLCATIIGFSIVTHPESLAYVAGDGSVLTAFSSLFAHFGWLHLIGNLYFLFAFGDALEQRLGRWQYALAFVLGGALAAMCEGLSAPDGAMIGGASGSVAVVMGAVFVLQPQAKVVTRLVITVAKLPMWGFAIFELGYQFLMFLLDVPGVAWTAHLVGLVLGVFVGCAAKLLALETEQRT